MPLHVRPLAEPPYGMVPVFRRISSEHVARVRAQCSDEFGAQEAARVLIAHVLLPDVVEWDICVAHDISWADLITGIMDFMKKLPGMPDGWADNIMSVALSSRGTLRPAAPGRAPRCCLQRVIDTRPTAPPPAVVLPSGAKIFVVLFHRRSIGWLPPQALTFSCHTCKLPEASERILRVCGGCKVTLYCSPECQRVDWPRHKRTCPALAVFMSCARQVKKE